MMAGQPKAQSANRAKSAAAFVLSQFSLVFNDLRESANAQRDLLLCISKCLIFKIFLNTRNAPLKGEARAPPFGGYVLELSHRVTIFHTGIIMNTMKKTRRGSASPYLNAGRRLARLLLTGQDGIDTLSQKDARNVVRKLIPDVDSLTPSELQIAVNRVVRAVLPEDEWLCIRVEGAAGVPYLRSSRPSYLVAADLTEIAACLSPHDLRPFNFL